MLVVTNLAIILEMMISVMFYLQQNLECFGACFILNQSQFGYFL